MTVFTDVAILMVSQTPFLSNINFTGMADVIFFVLLSVFFSSPSPFFLQPFVFVFPSRLWSAVSSAHFPPSFCLSSPFPCPLLTEHSHFWTALLKWQISEQHCTLACELQTHFRSSLLYRKCVCCSKANCTLDSDQFRFLSGKLSTYPSPKLTLTLNSHFGQNDGLREG